MTMCYYPRLKNPYLKIRLGSIEPDSAASIVPAEKRIRETIKEEQREITSQCIIYAVK
ncbi:hypothetical protein Pecwa_2588 [Pectobacterium parmentieri WPP163]|nr:hypothetical protein Pecwa_2588 [Pectobacterium parmentieri WPP163]